MPTVPASHSFCPDCGSPLPEGVSALLCPVCALGDVEAAAPASERYTLLGEIGRGGMGVVYLARQESLRRQVAMKVLPGAAFSSQEFRQRFQREAETAAHLSHPGIVAIHEVGEHLGQPFIAMELIEGPSLADRLQSGRMTPELAAHIVRQVGRAVAHAHERGVIHRDLKPSNILLRDDTEPVLTDFGLAKFTQTGNTLSRGAQSLGSPGYLPPERVGMSEVEASVLEDVYGLGAVLYHCLTGRAPFTADSLAALLAATQTQDPVAPRLLNPSLPLDLQTICLRCLEKQPAARYATAKQVADELDRFLRGEPILARPVGMVARLVKRARRQPLLTALSAALVVTILSGTALSIMAWRRAKQEAETRRVELYSSDVSAAAAALAGGHPAQARALLLKAVPVGVERDLRGPEWHMLRHLLKPLELDSVQAHDHILTSLSWSPSGDYLLSGAHDGSLKLWSVNNRRKLVLEKQLLAPGQPRLQQAVWWDDRTYVAAEERAWIRWRSLNAERPAWEVRGQQFAISAKAKLMATSEAGPFFYEPGGRVTLWRLGDGPPEKLETLPQLSRAVALSQEGRWLAMSRAHKGRADTENGVWLLDLQHRDQAARLLATAGPVWSLGFSPSGEKLAVTLFQGSTDVLMFETGSGASLPPLRGHALRPWSVTFTGNKDSQITTSADRTLRVWADGHEVSQVMAAHENEVWCAALRPDQSVLATGDKDGVLKLFPFPLPAQPLAALPRFAHGRYEPLLFTPDSRSLVCVPAGRKAVVQPLPSGEPLSLPADSPLVGYDVDQRMWHWNQSSRQLWSNGKQWTLPVPKGAAPEVLHAELVQTGRYFFTLHEPGCAVRLDVLTGEACIAEGMLQKPISDDDPLKAAALSPDGRILAVATWHELVLHDFVGGETRRFSNDPHWARDIAFSSDARFMATAGIDGHIHLRHLPEGGWIATLNGHLEEASGVAFSPDGKTLVSCEIGLGLRFWRLDTLREVLHLPIPEMAEALRFSPDGRWLAAGLCRPGAEPEKGEVLILPVQSED